METRRGWQGESGFGKLLGREGLGLGCEQRGGMFWLIEIRLPFKAYLMPSESERLGMADGQGASTL